MDRKLVLLLALSGMVWGQLLAPIFTTSPVVATGSFGTLTEYSNTSMATGTTCTVATVTLAIGDLVYVGVDIANNGIYITSVTGQTGSLIDMQTSYPTGGAAGIFVIPSASTVSAATVTINLSGTSGGSQCHIWRYAVTSGTPALDAVLSTSVASTSTLAVPTPTLSGTNAAVVTQNGFGGTALGGSWTNTHFTSGQGLNYALGSQKNVSSLSAANYTGSGMSSASTVAYSFNPSSCLWDAIMDSSGGTNAGTPTATTMNNSTFGLSIPGAGDLSYAWSITGSQITYSNSANVALGYLGSPKRACFGGTNLPATSTLGTVYAAGTSNSYMQLTLPFNSFTGYSPNILVVTVPVNFDLLDTDTFMRMDTVGLIGKSGSDLIEMEISNGGGTAVCVDTEFASANTACFNLPHGTNYYFEYQFNGHFAAQSPGGSLTGGVQATVSMNPCPYQYFDQVLSANTVAPLSLAGGTGAAEIITPGNITGTCVTPGTASGTVIFTPSNSHTGAWTVALAHQARVKTNATTLASGVPTMMEPASDNVTIPGGLSYGNNAGSAVGPAGRHIWFGWPRVCSTNLATCPF